LRGKNERHQDKVRNTRQQGKKKGERSFSPGDRLGVGGPAKGNSLARGSIWGREQRRDGPCQWLIRAQKKQKPKFCRPSPDILSKKILEQELGEWV